MNLRKLWLFWRYFGTLGLFEKAIEKLIIDRRRYSGTLNYSLPNHDYSQTKYVNDYESQLKQIDICFLVHYFYPDKEGGTERFVLNMALEMQKRGCTVRVVTLGLRPLKEYGGHVEDVYFRDYLYKGVPVTEFRYKKAPKGLYYRRIEENDKSIGEFAKLILGRERFNILHCAFPQPFSAFLKTSAENGIPYVVTNTGFGIFCHYTTIINRKGEMCGGSDFGAKCEGSCPAYGIDDYSERYYASSRLLKGAAFITAPSAFVASILEEEYPGISVFVIGHGIGENYYYTHKSGRVSRFAYVGTFTRMKGIHNLIAAFSGVAGEMTLDLYGRGDPAYEAELRKMAAGDSRIHFCGAVEESAMPGVYRQHDCIVIPSVVPETYNFVIREAIQSGCIVVASRIGAMPEAVHEGRNGFLFEAGNESDLKEMLIKAKNFDWASYECSEFISVETEAAQYASLYEKSLRVQENF